MNHQQSNSSMKENILQLLELRRTDDASLPGLGMDGARLVSCDEQSRTIELSFPTLPWMTNPAGVVHGGVVSILMDNGMGVACHSLYRRHNPTITMTINYLRPVPLNSTIIVRARVTSFGRTVSYTSAELYLAGEPDRILATATGVYSTKQ